MALTLSQNNCYYSSIDYIMGLTHNVNNMVLVEYQFYSMNASSELCSIWMVLLRTCININTVITKV